MDTMYTPLQLRELFHIEFLRWFGRKIKPRQYVIKGGVNIRLFFKSIRYSEDMDLDVEGAGVAAVQEAVMSILGAESFQNTLKPFGIERIGLPDMTKAKQTETTQRFKAHLYTYAGEDLFTKIEFSRRGFGGTPVIEGIPDAILRAYKASPLLIPHYDIASAVVQKIGALVGRSVTQARDIFDLYALGPQYDPLRYHLDIDTQTLAKAHEKAFSIDFEEFRDTVIAYLANEDTLSYSTPEAWDDIKLKVARFIEDLGIPHERP